MHCWYTKLIVSDPGDSRAEGLKNLTRGSTTHSENGIHKKMTPTEKRTDGDPQDEWV
jgi:hypothetical protein